MRLSATQVGAKIGVTGYTLKRWYEFYEDLDQEEIEILTTKFGMPRLPKYEITIAGQRRDKTWSEEDVPVLEVFRDWVPPTRSGIFKQFGKNKKG